MNKEAVTKKDMLSPRDNKGGGKISLNTKDINASIDRSVSNPLLDQPVVIAPKLTGKPRKLSAIKDIIKNKLRGEEADPKEVVDNTNQSIAISKSKNDGIKVHSPLKFKADPTLATSSKQTKK